MTSIAVESIRAALPAALARALETQLGVWHRDERHDLTAAEAVLARAVTHDRTDPTALQMLASLRRSRPSAALVETSLPSAVLAARSSTYSSSIVSPK